MKILKPVKKKKQTKKITQNLLNTHFQKIGKRKDLIYEAKKYLIFNNLKQSFGDSILSGKITLDEAGQNQNNLLIFQNSTIQL